MKISEVRQNLISLYGNNISYDDLKTYIIDQRYYKNLEHFTSVYEKRIATFERNIALNDEKISSLETIYDNLVKTSNLQQADQLLAMIADYTVQNVEYQQNITDYQDIIDNATLPDTEFLQLISDIETILNQYTDTYNTYLLNALNDTTEITYDTNTVFVLEDDASGALIAVISLVIGAVVALVVALLKESIAEENIKALKKKENK